MCVHDFLHLFQTALSLPHARDGLLFDANTAETIDIFFTNNSPDGFLANRTALTNTPIAVNISSAKPPLRSLMFRTYKLFGQVSPITERILDEIKTVNQVLSCPNYVTDGIEKIIDEDLEELREVQRKQRKYLHLVQVIERAGCGIRRRRNQNACVFAVKLKLWDIDGQIKLCRKKLGALLRAVVENQETADP